MLFYALKIISLFVILDSADDPRYDTIRAITSHNNTYVINVGRHLLGKFHTFNRDIREINYLELCEQLWKSLGYNIINDKKYWPILAKVIGFGHYNYYLHLDLCLKIENSI